MNSLSTWKFILDCLQRNFPVVLLYVVDSKGSSPGRQGFVMAVTENDMAGSIGGGIMEHKFVEMAKERLMDSSLKFNLKKQFHNKNATKNQSGMICSGEQTILLFNLTKGNLASISEIVNTISSGMNGILKIQPDSFEFIVEKDMTDQFLFSVESEEKWIYKELLGKKNILYIIGGGHCSLAFSRLMKGMDFYIVLFEERKNLNTLEKNIFVDEKKILEDYSLLNSLVPEGNNIFVVIMTFGYRSDNVALRTLIDKNFRYLGVLGSKSKINKMFEEWRNDNLQEEKLSQIHAPIGISIKSRTPEEIAISIAAEIISVKNS